MDKGSSDGICEQIRPIDVDVVGKVVLAVLEGFMYSYDVHRVIRRGEFSTAPFCRPPPRVQFESEWLWLK